jgi:hypothetical protein
MKNFTRCTYSQGVLRFLIKMSYPYDRRTRKDKIMSLYLLLMVSVNMKYARLLITFFLDVELQSCRPVILVTGHTSVTSAHVTSAVPETTP